MTTLESIGFTIAGGSVVFTTTLALFGLAVSKRSTFIAPRCTARPRDVIYNPNPTHSSQDRGNPMLGWIPWTLSLDYDTMLRGVPGTGTREGGLSGSMLRITMDSVVLLRFHSMCLRICAVATLICTTVLLPTYLSAQCYRLSEAEAMEFPACASLQYNLTNYERTTLANVPSLTDADAWAQIGSPSANGVLARLYATCFCFWIICAYTCRQLRDEWISLLAMRRVYYLEFDHWQSRREELKQTLMYNEQRRKKDKDHFTFDAHDTGENTESHLTNRDPWIPHPEQRDTVPNIALYSLLVGGLPSLPEQSAEAFDTEATINFSKRESIDWQLSITSTFFDHCVPNQPGFSSSVAAVTIIPGAMALSRAWKKWLAAASKLRRLRFIRAQIAERRHFDIDADDEDAQGESQLMRDLELGSPAISQNLPEETPRVYGELSRNRDYYREVLGSIAVGEEESHIFEALSFGPEQTAVYSREFAQAAAPCCPNGCFEGKIRRAGIDDLLRMEKDAAADVHKANLALRKARQKATQMDADEPVNSPALSSPVGPPQDPSQPKSEMALTPPRSTAKKHRRVPSVEIANMPSDLGLESTLYSKGNSFSLEGPRTRLGSGEGLRARLDSGESNTTGPPKVMSSIQEEQMKKRESSASLPNMEVASTPGAASGVLLPTNYEPENPPLTMSSWQHVESIVAEAKTSQRSLIASGKWTRPSLDSFFGLNFRSFFGHTKTGVGKVKKWAKAKTAGAVEDLARESTYAVVTFTSRQAAVAARNCLADGRGVDRWVAFSDLPIAPLADASSCDPLTCRNCCRPVTLSINDRQKTARNYCAIMLLATIYVFYTVPLAAAAALVDPESLDELFPGFGNVSEDWGGVEFTSLISGFMTALIQSSFFALCPIMFKSIANCGSRATSVASAEFKALQYYWWFMVITAFSGQLLVSMVLRGFNDGLKFGSEFREVLRAIGLTIPSTIAATWLNWIIFRLLITLPCMYLLQLNTYLFSTFNMNCCSRLVRGGGSGGPVPYRVFVDSGVVLLCTLALAPASPLVASASFVYFLFCVPLLRRNVLFMYRPVFDGGGLRWPFVFDMCISALIMGEILLLTQMVLKSAIGPAIAAGLPIIPTLLFQRDCKARFMKAYKDAALLQTSLLDGWDTTEESSTSRREEFRQFLVDSHKAAYVPVCIAGTDTEEYLTAEPAVVVPEPGDTDFEGVAGLDMPDEPLNVELPEDIPVVALPGQRRMSVQHGATLRRAVNSISAMRRRASSAGSGFFDSVITSAEDELSQVSPFERGVSRRDLMSQSKRE